MGHIQRGHLKKALTICPPDNVISKLGEIIGPLVERTIKNELESCTLSITRNQLIPKLMSGTIHLSEAQKRVEAIS